MLNMIKTDKLKEHHKNGYYFTDIEGEKYEEVRRSIEQYGIRDPIKITTDYTVISGHQRLRIARDIGMEKVPVEMIPDLSEQEVEYLLIAENVERRGQAETDPIKKARIGQFLKEYWDIKNTGNNRNFDRQSDGQKTIKDVQDIFGLNERTMQRIMKLNDLIPELQDLVSQGKLGTTAGEQLAHMTEDNQRALLNVLGDEIEKTTVAKAREYRGTERDVDSSKEYEKKIKMLQKQVESERKERERLEQREPRVIEKEVVKEVDKTDYERIRFLEERERILEEKLDLYKNDVGEYNSLKEQLNKLYAETDSAYKQMESATSLSSYVVDIEHLINNKLAPVKYIAELTDSKNNETALKNLNKIIELVDSWSEDLKRYISEESDVIDVEVL